MTPNGIVAEYGDTQVHLDPKKGVGRGITFVSHAHIDHLHRNAGGLFGGAVALLNKVDSAAFFTFAGIALGGLTALFASSPSGK